MLEQETQGLLLGVMVEALVDMLVATDRPRRQGSFLRSYYRNNTGLLPHDSIMIIKQHVSKSLLDAG